MRLYNQRCEMLIIYMLSQQKELELIPNGMNAKVRRTWNDKLRQGNSYEYTIPSALKNSTDLKL